MMDVESAGRENVLRTVETLADIYQCSLSTALEWGTWPFHKRTAGGVHEMLTIIAIDKF
jgi:hypothetical protein